jgi:putative SOS response-associated peptidase YedK
MCGRFNLTATPETIAEHFQLQRPPCFQPSYNITPAQKILSIVELEDKSLKVGAHRRVQLFLWRLAN